MLHTSGLSLTVLAFSRCDNAIMIRAGIPQSASGISGKLFKNGTIWKFDNMPDDVLIVETGVVRFLSPGREVMFTFSIKHNSDVRFYETDVNDDERIPIPMEEFGDMTPMPMSAAADDVIYPKKSKHMVVKFVESFLHKFDNLLLDDTTIKGVEDEF